MCPDLLRCVWTDRDWSGVIEMGLDGDKCVLYVVAGLDIISPSQFGLGAQLLISFLLEVKYVHVMYVVCSIPYMDSVLCVVY